MRWLGGIRGGLGAYDGNQSDTVSNTLRYLNGCLLISICTKLRYMTLGTGITVIQLKDDTWIIYSTSTKRDKTVSLRGKSFVWLGEKA